MRKRIWRISEDRFDDPKPQIEYSPTKVEQIYLSNGEKKGSFQMVSKNGVNMRGIVYSSSPYVHVVNPEFDGTEVTISFELSDTAFFPGDELSGFFDIIYNRGTSRLEFRFTFQEQELKSSEGNITSMADFLRLTQNHPQEAMRLFYRPEFQKFINRESQEVQAVYRGFINASPSMENFFHFLDGAKLHDAVDFRVTCPETTLYQLTSDWQGKVSFTKTNWGYLKIQVSTDASFITFPRDIIMDSDFLGREYSFPFFIHASKLHQGRNVGHLYFQSGDKKLEIEVFATPDSKLELEERKYDLIKIERKDLLNKYFEMQLGRLSQRDFAQQLLIVLESERKVDERVQEETEGYLSAVISPWYHLLEAYARILLHEKQEVLYQIRDLKEEIEDHYSAEWAFLLYLCTLIESDEDYIRRLREEMEKIFRLNPEDMRIFLMLLPIRLEYQDDPARKLKDIRQWVVNGFNSPFLLYEAYELYRKFPFLLQKVDEFSRNVLIFMYKRKAFTRELSMQIVEVMHQEQEAKFDPALLRVLKTAYETYSEDDLLTEIIQYMIRQKLFGKDASTWYQRGIDHELRISGLYEAYLISVSSSTDINLPEKVKLFFQYPNQLQYQQKAMLYAFIVSEKEADPRTYREYITSIDSFVREQLNFLRVDENLVILYQNAMDHNLLQSDAMRQMSHLFFLNRITVKREDIVRVVVYEDLLKDPIMAPVQNGRCYISVPSEDDHIFLETADGIRICDPSLYHREPLFYGDKNKRELRRLTDVPLFYILPEVKLDAEGSLSAATSDSIALMLSAPEIRTEYIAQILPKVTRVLEQDGRRELLDQYLWEHRQGALPDPALRSIRLSYGISSGHYEESFALLKSCFVLKSEKHQMLRLMNEMIRKNEDEADDFLISLAAGLMMNDAYSETTVRYLSRFYTGPTTWLRRLFELTELERMENSELCSRILIEMMYQDENTAYPSAVFQGFLRKQPNRMVAEAFLTYWSHEYLLGGVVPDASFFANLVRICRVDDDPNSSLRIALMRYLCEKENLSDEELRILEKLMRYHIVRNIYFAFYKKADYRLIVRFHLYDKVFIEYHGDKNQDVVLHYHRPGQIEYQEKLDEMYDGIYVKQFVLFFGESIEYEIYTENVSLPVVKDRIVGQQLIEEGPGNRFQMLNAIESDQIYGNLKDLKQDMESYDRYDYLTNQLFHGI